MPKYDAFGREIGEDPLEGLGWASGGTVEPAQEVQPEPVPRPEPVMPTAAPEASYTATPQPPPRVMTPPPPPAAARPPQPPPPVMSSSGGTVPPVMQQFMRPRRRRPLGFRLMSRLITLVVFIAIAVTVVPNLTSGIKDATDLNIDIDRPDIKFPDIEGAPAVAEPPVGLGPGSLIRPAAFRRALADLRGRDLGRVKNLRLAPDRIDAELLTSGGRLRSVQRAHDGEFRQFSVSGSGFGHLATIPYAEIEPGAPQRLVKAGAERLGKPASRIDYLVASEFDGDVMWNAYFKGGAIFQADRRGKIVRRVS